MRGKIIRELHNFQTGRIGRPFDPGRQGLIGEPGFDQGDFCQQLMLRIETELLGSFADSGPEAGALGVGALGGAFFSPPGGRTFNPLQSPAAKAVRNRKAGQGVPPLKFERNLSKR